MKNKRNYLFIFFLFISSLCFSQEIGDNTIKIGILQVTSNYNESYSFTLQAILTKVFSEKKRFTVVDRTKLNEVLKEKNLQKKEDFINGSFLAEQGKSIGAQYLVSTTINNIVYSTVTIEKQAFLTNQKTYVSGLQVSINISFSLIDVATGSVKSGKSYQKSFQYESQNVDASITKTLNSFEGNIMGWLNDVFPVEMKIIRIESKDKHGKPETVLIKGGSDMDLRKNKTLIGLNISSELDVYYNDILNVDGVNMTRKVVIGRIKISENQGEFSLAKVKKGAEEIQTKLDEGKTLLLSIVKY